MSLSPETEVPLEPSAGEDDERISSIEVAPCPRVSGALLCACRAAFVERGDWEGLRAELAARMRVQPEALDTVAAGDWLELGSLCDMLEVQLAYVDLDGLKTCVRRRVFQSECGHVFAPMLRAWTRSFASGEHMLRALGPLFRAALRNVAGPRVLGVSAGEAHVVLGGPLLAPLHASEALRAGFEGLLLGLLDLARPRPMMPEVELCFDRDELRARCRF